MSKSSAKHEQSKPHRSTLQTIALIYVAIVSTMVLASAVLLQTGSMIMLFGAILPVIIVLYIFSKSFKHFS